MHPHSKRRTMSSDFQALGNNSKERYMYTYQQKLELAGMPLKHEPYLPGWSSNVHYWPKKDYGDIFSYFISRPGTFTL